MKKRNNKEQGIQNYGRLSYFVNFSRAFSSHFQSSRIKNPKRSSTTNNDRSVSPTNQPRGSSPFPNPSPSTQPYVNNIDRAKKNIDLATWGVNPNPASTQPNPVIRGSIFNDIPSAKPNNIPSGNQPRAPTAHNYLFTPPVQPIEPANKQTSPISRNLVGVNNGVSPRISNLQTVPQAAQHYIKQPNTSLFGNTEIPNRQLNQVTQRVPQGQGNDRSYSSAKRDGSFSDLSSRSIRPDRSPTSKMQPNYRSSQDRGRSKSPMSRSSSGGKKKGLDFQLVVLGGMLVVLIIVAVLVLLNPRQPKYWKTGVTDNIPEGYEPCPEHGICQNGKLVVELYSWIRSNSLGL